MWDLIMWDTEPRVGDWIVDTFGRNWWIIEISYLSDKFRLRRDIDGAESVLDGATIENSFRPWTIKDDAKPGDIISITLCPEGVWTGIFKSLESHGSFSSYCFVSTNGVFKTGSTGHANLKIAHPATDEQRKLLWEKMKESGYGWDSHKKILKRFDHKPRFREGDVIVRAKNLDIRYIIREVGVPNELGGYDYVTENISEGSPDIRMIHNMDIEKVDDWGIFDGCALLKD